MEKIAGNIMSKKLIMVNYGDSVRKAYQIMQERKIRHLPVCDDGGAIIGILSDRDLQRAMTPTTAKENGMEDGVEFNESFLAKDFMSWPVRSISKDVSVEDLAKRMLIEKVSAFLVTDHNRVALGIVTTDDLIKLLIELLKKEPDHLKHSLNAIISEFGFNSRQWE